MMRVATELWLRIGAYSKHVTMSQMRRERAGLFQAARFKSIATTWPRGPTSSARWAALPPGAAAISDDRVAGRRQHLRHDLRRLRLRIADTVAQGVSVEQGRIAEHDRFREAPARREVKAFAFQPGGQFIGAAECQVEPQHVRRSLIVGGHQRLGARVARTI